MKERTTYNIKMEKKLRIERMAMEAGMKIGRPIKWTEFLETMIDNFAKDTQELIIYRETKNKEKIRIKQWEQQ